MNLKQFKDEFRLICSDTWGNAMEAWFECAGHLNKRGEDIPNEWQYRCGMSGDGTDKDSYWYSIFKNTSTKRLRVIGGFLFRYCQYLKMKGIDY